MVHESYLSVAEATSYLPYNNRVGGTFVELLIGVAMVRVVTHWMSGY